MTIPNKIYIYINITLWGLELTSPESTVRRLTYCSMGKVLKVSLDQWDAQLTSNSGSLILIGSVNLLVDSPVASSIRYSTPAHYLLLTV